MISYINDIENYNEFLSHYNFSRRDFQLYFLLRKAHPGLLSFQAHYFKLEIR